MKQKDICDLYWSHGLEHYTTDSSMGRLSISVTHLELTVSCIGGTRVLKSGKSVKDLKQYANEFHKNTLFCNMKKFVKSDRLGDWNA